MRLRSLFLVFCLVVAGRAFGEGLSAEQKAEAQRAFENGSKKFNLGRYEEAAAEFERGYTIAPSPGFLYNMAKAYRLANKYERALNLYKAFRSQEPSSPYRDEVNKQITDLQNKIAEEQAAAEKAAAEEKRKKEEAERKKEELERARVLEAERERARREAELKAQGFTVKEKPHPRLDLVGYGLVGAGIAVLGAGAGLSAVAMVNSNDLSSAATKGSTFTQALLDKQRSGKTFGIVGPALLAIGGVATVAGIAAIAIGVKWRKEDKAKKLVRVMPWADPTGVGVIVGGAL